MSTSQLIKFRHLESQLDQQERVKFVRQLALQSSHIITDALFLYFLKSANGETENDNVNELLSKIIASRKMKPKTEGTKTNLKIDRIPNQLIGAIASFMQQKDYINFSKANRTVYLGCNTPNLMQELDLIKVKDCYSSVNLSLYRSVKELRITNMPQFQLSNGSTVLNRVHALEINGSNIDNIDIDDFLALIKKHINVNNISTLRLDEFGMSPGQERLHINQLYKLLSVFPNVQNLNMSRLILNGLPDPSKMYPTLRGLGVALSPNSAISALVGHYCDGLSHLMLTSVSTTAPNFAQKNFTKLQSLDFLSGSSKHFGDILKTATTLKKIQLNFHEISISDTEYAVTNAIKSCQSLEIFELSAELINNKGQLQSILEGLERGLFATKKMETKRNENIFKVRWLQYDQEHDDQNWKYYPLAASICGSFYVYVFGKTST